MQNGNARRKARPLKSNEVDWDDSVIVISGYNESMVITDGDQPAAYRFVIYRYANIMWFSKYRWNIVIAFFWPYHTIFLGHFLPIFTYFYL